MLNFNIKRDPFALEIKNNEFFQLHGAALMNVAGDIGSCKDYISIHQEVVFSVMEDIKSYNRHNLLDYYLNDVKNLHSDGKLTIAYLNKLENIVQAIIDLNFSHMFFIANVADHSPIGKRFEAFETDIYSSPKNAHTFKTTEQLLGRIKNISSMINQHVYLSAEKISHYLAEAVVKEYYSQKDPGRIEIYIINIANMFREIFNNLYMNNTHIMKYYIWNFCETNNAEVSPETVNLLNNSKEMWLFPFTEYGKQTFSLRGKSLGDYSVLRTEAVQERFSSGILALLVEYISDYSKKIETPIKCALHLKSKGIAISNDFAFYKIAYLNADKAQSDKVVWSEIFKKAKDPELNEEMLAEEINRKFNVSTPIELCYDDTMLHKLFELCYDDKSGIYKNPDYDVNVVIKIFIAFMDAGHHDLLFIRSPKNDMTPIEYLKTHDYGSNEMKLKGLRKLIEYVQDYSHPISYLSTYVAKGIIEKYNSIYGVLSEDAVKVCTSNFDHHLERVIVSPYYNLLDLRSKYYFSCLATDKSCFPNIADQIYRVLEWKYSDVFTKSQWIEFMDGRYHGIKQQKNIDHDMLLEIIRQFSVYVAKETNNDSNFLMPPSMLRNDDDERIETAAQQAEPKKLSFFWKMLGYGSETSVSTDIVQQQELSNSNNSEETKKELGEVVHNDTV